MKQQIQNDDTVGTYWDSAALRPEGHSSALSCDVILRIWDLGGMTMFGGLWRGGVSPTLLSSTLRPSNCWENSHLNFIDFLLVVILFWTDDWRVRRKHCVSNQSGFMISLLLGSFLFCPHGHIPDILQSYNIDHTADIWFKESLTIGLIISINGINCILLVDLS